MSVCSCVLRVVLVVYGRDSAERYLYSLPTSTFSLESVVHVQGF